VIKYYPSGSQGHAKAATSSAETGLHSDLHQLRDRRVHFELIRLAMSNEKATTAPTANLSRLSVTFAQGLRDQVPLKQVFTLTYTSYVIGAFILNWGMWFPNFYVQLYFPSSK
jgi:hypothetical protein